MPEQGKSILVSLPSFLSLSYFSLVASLHHSLPPTSQVRTSVTIYEKTKVPCSPESIATLRPLGPIERHKWFDYKFLWLPNHSLLLEGRLMGPPG